ncbi:hypothetical protein ACOME3_008114 [Neoechinorhynchus agilis]
MSMDPDKRSIFSIEEKETSLGQLYKLKCIEVLQQSAEISRLQRSLDELKMRSCTSNNPQGLDTDLLRHLNNQLNIKDRQLVEKDTIIRNLMDTHKSLQPNERHIIMSESMPEVNRISRQSNASLRLSKSFYKDNSINRIEAMKRVKLGVIRVIRSEADEHVNRRYSSIKTSYDAANYGGRSRQRNLSIRKSASFASQRLTVEGYVKRKTVLTQQEPPCQGCRALPTMAKERLDLEKTIAELMRYKALKDTNEALRLEVARLAPVEDNLKALEAKLAAKCKENEELSEKIKITSTIDPTRKVDRSVQVISASSSAPIKNEASNEKDVLIKRLQNSLDTSHQEKNELERVNAELRKRDSDTSLIIKDRDEIQSTCQTLTNQLSLVKNSYEKRLMHLYDERNNLEKKLENDYVHRSLLQ